MPKTRYLIIGNSAGGIGAAEAIRQLDSEGSLTIISDEPYLTYSRPLISEYLAGECSLDSMLYRRPDFYARNRIQTILGRKAIGIDFAGKLVELDDGGRIAWQKLLLATGGTPIAPPVKGVDKGGVFTFTTIDDAERIRKAISPASTAVVIGGGLIGMSVTRPLVKCGVTVIMVELLDRVLSTMLDAQGSRLAEAELQRNGVTLITGQTISEIVGRPEDEGQVGGVILDDGRRLPCDLVVFAIGVRPRLELVAGSAVATNRGIIVDRRMATSVRDVYACGDVAEAFDFVHKGNRVIPVWPNAYLGGRIAGQNMAGLASKHTGGTAMNSLNCFGLSIVSAGMMDPPDDPTYEVLSTGPSAASYRKIVLKNNRVVGMIFIGEIERSGVVFGLMKDGINVGSFKESLLARDFGLSYFPDHLRRERLGAPPPAATLVAAAAAGAEETVMAE
ncbi:MAG: FAD-dependent oxidoreductase [Chloroflexota bacterium]|nr:FAD-dependent oxidoreductase [Chloroflexota bacterium]